MPAVPSTVGVSSAVCACFPAAHADVVASAAIARIAAAMRRPRTDRAPTQTPPKSRRPGAARCDDPTTLRRVAINRATG
jgi:hypothetical protein